MDRPIRGWIPEDKALMATTDTTAGSARGQGEQERAVPGAPGRRPKPFVKWAGGKRQLLGRLRELYPPGFGTYHEPFVGGGAVFFDLTATHGCLGPRAVLTDVNQELMDCYRAIRVDVKAVIAALKQHRYEERYYYHQREQDPVELSLAERAARMIYLNRTGFNGLYRVNSKGKFNVPFGRHKNPTICDAPNLLACAEALADVALEVEPFEAVVDRARPGDFVYCDPPYIPLSATANFTAYQKHGFGMANQDKLAEVFERLAARDVLVMLSNSDVPWVHERYGDHAIRVIKARRAVNSNGARRGPVGEVVVTSY
jgi:DNA adenine methylase